MLVRHRCRAMLMAKDGEVSRLQEQLQSAQDKLASARQHEASGDGQCSNPPLLPTHSRPHRRRSTPHSCPPSLALAVAPVPPTPAHSASPSPSPLQQETSGFPTSRGGGGGGLPTGDGGAGVGVGVGVGGGSGSGSDGLMRSEASLLATARQQAVHDAEVERWKTRATSLEARMRGATEARRKWGLREAELVERLEQQGRLLQAQGRLENLEYLRNTMLKYFELGPGCFDEVCTPPLGLPRVLLTLTLTLILTLRPTLTQVFPLLSAFLEFSPDEQRRARSGHFAHLAGADPTTLWGLLGNNAPASEASNYVPSALAPLPHSLRVPATPGAAGLTPALTAPGTPAAGLAALNGGGAGPPPPAIVELDASGAASALADAKAEKILRMRKLLAAADKRIAQANAELQERDAQIRRLEGRLAGR